MNGRGSARDMTQQSSVLITGGAGYLGSTLVGVLLEIGYAVRVIDSLLYGGESLLSVWNHPSFEFVHGDIRDAAVVRPALKDIDTVIHLAAIVGDPACARQPSEARDINLHASLSLLQECQRADVSRFIFASTCSNYGKPERTSIYLREDAPLAPVSLYAETKVQVEAALRELKHSEPFSATSLRFASLFGASQRMRFDLTVNEFARDMVVAKRLVVYGEHTWRPHVHVYDAARAVCAVLANPETVKGQVYNVGATSQNYRKVDLVGIMREHVPDAEVEYTNHRTDPRDYRVCFEKIFSELGFSISRTVQQGAADLVRLLKSGAIREPHDPIFRN
jgi:nucleoside-diphosphate-sugar epimerase